VKTALILSSDQQEIDLLRDAISAVRFDGKVEVLKSTTRLLERLPDLESTPPAAVFVDISGISDGVRLVEWLRLSSRLRLLRVTAIGEESDAMTIFRNAWGSQAVLTKPLRAAAVEQLVADLGLAPIDRDSLPANDERKKMLEAIQRSKRLREEQEQLLRHVDALRAELKDKKAPFTHKRISRDDQAA
jgi:hypothetical protein